MENTALAINETTDFVAFAKELEKKTDKRKTINDFAVGDFIIGTPNNGYCYLTENTYLVITFISKDKGAMQARAIASTIDKVVDKLFTIYPRYFEIAPPFEEWRKEYEYMNIGRTINIYIPDYKTKEKGDIIKANDDEVTVIEAKETKSNKVTNFTTYKTGKTTTQAYVYKGKLNQSAFPDFIKICKMSEKKLKQYLCGRMKEIFKENCIIGDGYIFCIGETPVMLTAHMDTVHNNLVKNYYEDVQTDAKGNTKHIISSPQGIGGDDRCGVYAILDILETGFRPYILFCEQEEEGGIGSEKFCKETKLVKKCLDLKFIIELDRANSKDLVFYSNDNSDWINWITETTGWKTEWGSFSDICHLSPAIGVSSVNMSVGYYKAHTIQEYVIMEELLNTIEEVKYILEESENVEQPFEYIAKKSYGYYGYNNRYSNYSYYNYGYDYDDYSYDSLVDYYNQKNKDKNVSRVYTDKGYEEIDDTATMWILEIDYMEEEGENMDIIKGSSSDACWRDFFFDHPTVCYDDVLDYFLYPYEY